MNFLHFQLRIFRTIKESVCGVSIDRKFISTIILNFLELLRALKHVKVEFSDF